MHVEFKSPFEELSARIGIKEIMLSCLEKLMEASHKSPRRFTTEQLTALREHIQQLDCFPIISSVSDPSLKCAASVISYILDQIVKVNVVFHLRFPNQASELLWMPWKPDQEQPARQPGGFHHIRIAGRPVVQARATKCYDRAYEYSGQEHAIEADTPAAITALYRETNAIFGLAQDGKAGVNMCLENDYANGRHYISEHSDDERAFGEVHDVFCWVTGPACREGVFRVRKARGGRARKRTSKPASQSASSRELFRMCIPAGLYVMKGRDFQRRYSHEFPKLHDHLFARICKHALGTTEVFADVEAKFPSLVEATDQGASQRALVQAAWLQAHQSRVLTEIKAGTFKTSKRNRIQTSIQEDCDAFTEWCLHRTSYTLRNFAIRTSKQHTDNRPPQKSRKRVKLE